MDRKGLSKLLLDIGIHASNLVVVDSFDEAKLQLKLTHFEVVLSESIIGDEYVNNLIDIHESVQPNKLNTVFAVISDTDSMTIRSFIEEEKIDFLK